MHNDNASCMSLPLACSLSPSLGSQSISPLLFAFFFASDFKEADKTLDTHSYYYCFLLVLVELVVIDCVLFKFNFYIYIYNIKGISFLFIYIYNIMIYNNNNKHI